MKTLSEYLSDQLKNRNPFFNWKIVIDSEKQMLELKIHIQVENKMRRYIQDHSGNVSNKFLLNYEQIICFYNVHSLLNDPENYICSIGVDPTIGIDQGLVDATLKQLNIYANEIVIQLHEFLTRDNILEFQPHWNTSHFQTTIQTLKDLKRYNTEKLKIDFDYVSPSIEKTRGEIHGDVERI